MNEPVICVDMDEVLVDFIGGVCDLWGVTRQELESVREPNRWDIIHCLETLTGETLSNTQFWSRINGTGTLFWANLEPLPWFKEMVEVLNSTGVPWVIISAPSRHWTCKTGKDLWLTKHLYDKYEDAIYTKHKALFSQPRRVLIDDRQVNIDKFIQVPVPGEAILFPSPGNHLRPMAHDPIPYVKIELGRLFPSSSSEQR